MKRKLFLLLVVLTSLALAACGSPAPAQAEPPAATEAPAEALATEGPVYGPVLPPTETSGSNLGPVTSPAACREVILRTNLYEAMFRNVPTTPVYSGGNRQGEVIKFLCQDGTIVSSEVMLADLPADTDVYVSDVSICPIYNGLDMLNILASLEAGTCLYGPSDHTVAEPETPDLEGFEAMVLYKPLVDQYQNTVGEITSHDNIVTVTSFEFNKATTIVAVGTMTFKYFLWIYGVPFIMEVISVNGTLYFKIPEGQPIQLQSG